MKPIEKKLLKIFNRLATPERDMLLNFAEFLAARAQGQAQTAAPFPPQPIEVPKPDNESVVAAIKRLSASYHMLDDSRLLNDASMLMSQHVMQGRDADEVINELEAIFERYYQDLLIELSGE